MSVVQIAAHRAARGRPSAQSCSLAAAEPPPRRPTSPAAVGLQLTDAERELAIQHAGRRMQEAMDRYEQTGCFAARGEADCHLLAMRRLIAERSPAQVARMERERGLA